MKMYKFYKSYITPALFILLLAVTPLRVVATSPAAGDNLFNTLLAYARVADASYQDSDAVAQALSAMGYSLISHGQLPGYGVSYFLGNDDTRKQQLLVVRGTSNVENAVVDAAFTLVENKHTGIKLHQGFGKSADDIYEKIQPHLRKDYRLNTTGHSLGGAAALILAMYADAGEYNVGRVVTFGQPKVTTIGGSRQYGHLDVTRVVMPRDIVPLVPPFDPLELKNLDIYWHQGTEIVLQPGNAYSTLTGKDSVMRATDFLNEMVSEKNLTHHFMANYIGALEEMQGDVEQIPYQSDFSVWDLFGGGQRANEK